MSLSSKLIKVEFIVKFKQSVENQERVDILIKTIQNHFEMRPLFEGEKDNNLSTIFFVSILKEVEVDKVIERLNRSEEVEYAHLPSPRSG